MKKATPNGITHFHKKYEFYLSPAEFLDMVWVYRNEIKPRLQCNPAAKEKSPRDFGAFLDVVRNRILNGDLQKDEFNEGEVVFFARRFTSVFAPFEEAVDQKIRKPDPEKIRSARNSFADLLRLLRGGEPPSVSSNLHDGNIVFQLGEGDAHA